MKNPHVSLDIETDGPIPGPYSMLSLGAVEIGTPNQFSVNIFPLEGASQDPDTMAWWAAHPDAFKWATTDQKTPVAAMALFHAWLRQLRGKPVAVAYPASFDFMFIYWYLIKFKGDSPFGFSAFDLKTAASVILKTPFRAINKRSMPRSWTNVGVVHSHIAIEDSAEQAIMATRMCGDLFEKG